MVLFQRRKELTAFDAQTGKPLWSAAGSGQLGGGPALYLIDGLVWNGGPSQFFPARNTYHDLLPNGPVDTWVEKEGRDPATGRVVRSVRVDNLFSCGHHYRCYRSKATERFILWPKRGVEFLDLKGNDFDRCDWLRATCRLGVMPCNGLLYVPPHQCFCYPGARIDGFNALAAGRESRAESPESGAEGRLEHGPAFGSALDSRPSPPDSSDWPTFRHDPRRSGASPTSVAADVVLRWRSVVGGKLSAPVVAEGKVLVSAVDASTIYCLDAEDGRPLWTYTAGGPVDSPPTVEAGRVLFGSADGWVYCLRACDGRLTWRFQAAPGERRVVAFGRVESAWPVHGSVLVRRSADGQALAYFAAGRSSFLDGGIRVYGLEPATGKVRYTARLEGPFPKIPQDQGRPHDMDGAVSEVLVSEGGAIFLRQIQFDEKLHRQETPRVTRIGDRVMGRHLFSTVGLLDGSWWNRGFRMYSSRWPGYYFGQAAPKTGQLLVVGRDKTYSVAVYDRPRHMFFPGQQDVRLTADDNRTEPMLKTGTENWDKGPGFQRERPPLWQQEIPVLVRAMVLADDTLFLAGPPDVLDAKDPLAAFEGRAGGLLWAVSAENGEKRAEARLDCPPVFDGLIAAGGRLYLAGLDGSVRCFGPPALLPDR